MVRYIKANYTLFPKFYEATSSIDAIFPKSEQYTTSWYLGEVLRTPRQNDSGDLKR